MTDNEVARLHARLAAQEQIIGAWSEYRDRMHRDSVHTVVICGSLNRAAAEIVHAAQEEWKKGHTVYAPVSQPDIPAEEHDLRHRVQILAADEIVVAVGLDGRIGDHTASEIAFAEDHGKPVRYYQPVGGVS